MLGRRMNFNVNTLLKRTAGAAVGVFAYGYINKYVEHPLAKYGIYTALLAINVPVPAAMELMTKLVKSEA